MSPRAISRLITATGVAIAVAVILLWLRPFSATSSKAPSRPTPNPSPAVAVWNDQYLSAGLPKGWQLAPNSTNSLPIWSYHGDATELYGLVLSRDTQNLASSSVASYAVATAASKELASVLGASQIPTPTGITVAGEPGVEIDVSETDKSGAMGHVLVLVVVHNKARFIAQCANPGHGLEQCPTLMKEIVSTWNWK